jgi:hypothetical protein
MNCICEVIYVYCRERLLIAHSSCTSCANDDDEAIHSFGKLGISFSPHFVLFIKEIN